MPAYCSTCHREAPCVSVEGLHCAGWTVGGPFNSMGWKCPGCRGDELFNLITEKEKVMHYRNGREAKNGDKIVQLTVADGKVIGVGVLYDAVPGNDYCNGMVAPIQNTNLGACLCDCLHLDDLTALLREKGLDKRPAGK